MYGLLRAQGYVWNNPSGFIITESCPVHHQCRRAETSRHMNPHLYVANYYGHKVYLDQNEKPSMFEVTHIMAIDGYSSKIVFLVTIPLKNCSLIHEHV